MPLGFVVTKSWKMSSPSGRPGPLSLHHQLRLAVDHAGLDDHHASVRASPRWRCGRRLMTTCFIFSASIVQHGDRLGPQALPPQRHAGLARLGARAGA